MFLKAWDIRYSFWDMMPIVWLLQIIGNMLLDYMVSHARKTVIFVIAAVRT